jgi:hypothetical protein
LWQAVTLLHHMLLLLMLLLLMVRVAIVGRLLLLLRGPQVVLVVTASTAHRRLVLQCYRRGYKGRGAVAVILGSGQDVDRSCCVGGVAREQAVRSRGMWKAEGTVSSGIQVMLKTQFKI